MFIRKKSAVYCEIHVKYTNALYGQNLELWYVETGGTIHSITRAFNG
jgi:hypothetical protein